MPSVLIGRTGGFQPDVLLDFTQAFYRKDGSIGTIPGIGGTITGSPSITSAGLLCTSGQGVSVPYTFTGDFVVVADFAAITTGVLVSFQHPSGGEAEFAAWGPSPASVVVNASTGGLSDIVAANPASTKVAFGWQGNTLKGSFMGGAVVNRSGTAPSLAGASSIKCGWDGTTNQANGRLRSLLIFKGAFTDLDFAAFSTP